MTFARAFYAFISANKIAMHSDTAYSEWRSVTPIRTNFQAFYFRDSV